MATNRKGASKTTKVLKFDDFFEPEFVLIGVCTPARDYRLCYGINTQLKIDLVRKPDLEIVVKEKPVETANFSFFEYGFDGDKVFHVYQNKIVGGYIIKELAHVDYLFVMRGYFNEEEIRAVHLQLRAVDVVTLAVLLDPLKYPSARKLML